MIRALRERDAQIREKDAKITEKDAQITEKDAQIRDLKDQLRVSPDRGFSIDKLAEDVNQKLVVRALFDCLTSLTLKTIA